MSSKLTVKKILILIAFFLFGFASTYIFDSFTKELRQDKISSILFKSKLGKQLSFVNVQLEFNKLASKDTDTTEINAYITLLKTSTGEINYKWSLPEGVQIISGTTEGQLTNITAESPQQLSLVVSNFSESDKKIISLTANTIIGGTVFGNVGLISSKPEDSYEFAANKNFQAKGRIDLSSQAPMSPRQKEAARLQR